MLPTQKNNKPIFAELGPYIGLGFQFAVTITIFIFLGNWLDTKYPSSFPIFLVLGAVLGFTVAIYQIIRAATQNEKKKEQ